MVSIVAKHVSIDYPVFGKVVVVEVVEVPQYTVNSEIDGNAAVLVVPVELDPAAEINLSILSSSK